MIQQIITNGISADYLSNVKSHDLVGMPEYCNTSPEISRLYMSLFIEIYFLKNKILI